MPAPEGYVAGLGRGATGFTTRSDLGPNVKNLGEEEIRALTEKAREKREAKARGEGGDDDDALRNPEDETGLLAGLGIETAEDREAEAIYDWVDAKMASRSKKRREAKERSVNPLSMSSDEYGRIARDSTAWQWHALTSSHREAREAEARDKDPIKRAFADVKRGLAAMTDDDWASIPDPKDMTQKNKRERQEAKQRFYAVPDSVLSSTGASQYNTSIDDGAGGGSEKLHNFAAYGQARKNVLESKLDSSVEKTALDDPLNSVDSSQYLQELAGLESAPDKHTMGDIRRIRELMISITKSNPNHAPGWMAAARLEELAGKTVAARNLTTKGVELCPKSEDLWLEHMRLHETSNAKIIAKEALSRNDRSIRIWTAAADLEKDVPNKQRVLRKAVEHVPESIDLWKSLIKLEQTDEGAKLLLAKAVEFIPSAEELWLALARLEEPKQAQAILNKARKLMPESYKVWVAASHLQEQTGAGHTCNALMTNAIKKLVRENFMPSKEAWLEEANMSEDNQLYETTQAIINQTIGWKVQEEDRLTVWLLDAKNQITKGKYHTARAIYRHAIKTYVNDETVYLAAADLEKNHGPEDKSTLYDVLNEGVNAVPSSEKLWIQYASEKQESGDPDGAREVLSRAFHQNPNNERIWLTAVNIERDAGNIDQARAILGAARTDCDTDRIHFKSATLEREQGNPQRALHLIMDGLARFPKCAKMYAIKGQIYQNDYEPANIVAAREAYSAGTRECPNDPLPWILLSRLEEQHGLLVKARSVLDRARTKMPKNASIWLESVRFERRAGEKSAAVQKMSQALQALPGNETGLLESEKLWYQEPRNNRKQAALQAIKKLEADAVFFISVARIFWLEQRIPKARNWFEKAVRCDPMLGDAWAWLLHFLQKEGTEEEYHDCISKCVAIHPTHGETWAQLAKDPKNASKSVEEILMMTVKGLDRTGMGESTAASKTA